MPFTDDDLKEKILKQIFIYHFMLKQKRTHMLAHPHSSEAFVRMSFRNLLNGLMLIRKNVERL